MLSILRKRGRRLALPFESNRRYKEMTLFGAEDEDLKNEEVPSKEILVYTRRRKHCLEKLSLNKTVNSVDVEVSSNLW